MMKGQAETNLDDDILSGDRPSYDKAAKKFLSKRRLLARILHHLIPEFRQVSRQDIEEKYIVGDPLVGTVPVATLLYRQGLYACNGVYSQIVILHVEKHSLAQRVVKAHSARLQCLVMLPRHVYAVYLRRALAKTKFL